MMNGFSLKLCGPLVGALTLAGIGSANAQNCENVKFGSDANRKTQNAGRDIIGKSLDQIQDQGHMLFAVYEDFAPYSYEDGGKLVGVDVDIAKLIAKEIGVEARFYATAADENVDADLRNNVWKGRLIGGQISNVMMHVPYNRQLACRNEQVVLTGQYFNERVGIAYNKTTYTEDAPTAAYFRFDKVGVENDTISDFYLSGVWGGILIPNIVRYKNYGQAMAGLAKGEVKAVMGPLGQLEHQLNDAAAIHTPPLPGLAAQQWTLGIAVRHTWRPLSYAVDDALRTAVSDGRLKAIFAKYGLSYTEPKW